MDLDEIIKLKRNDQLIPFIGSGFSSSLNLPMADGIIKMLAKELDWDYEIFRLLGDMSQLAEYYALVKGGGKIGNFRSKLDKAFGRHRDEIKKSEKHMMLAKCNFPIIYTTNYDNFIEESLEINDFKPHIITNLSQLSLPVNTKNIVIKFHGTFDDDESLVLTEESYFDRLELESALDIRLRSDILGKTLLFLGYSFRDLNLRYLLFKLQRLRQKHPSPAACPPIAILAEFYPNDVMKRICKKRDVEIYELNNEDNEKSMTEFLKKLL